MYLTRVRIENYRSIKGLDFQPSKLCALIGENNAGKSNILKALNLILGEAWPSERMFSEEDFYNHDVSKDIVIEVWGEPAFTLNRFGIDLDCHGLRIMVGHYKRSVKSKGKTVGDLKFAFAPIDKRGELLSGPDQRPTKGVKSTWMPVRVSGEIREAFPLVYVDVRREYARHTPGSRWSILSRLFAGVNEDFLRADNLVQDELGQKIPRRDAFRKKVDAAYELLRTDEFKKIEESIRGHAMNQVGLDPSSSDVRIDFRPFDPLNAYKALSLVLTEMGQEYEASEIGAGYQSSMVVAFFRAYQELSRQSAIIAIEEPEVFLHPHRQRFFSKILAGLATSGSQIFYTTHSAHFVDVTTPENVFIVRRTNVDGTRIFSCSPQQWTPDQKQCFKLEKEFDPERNEMFFSKGVLVCEGDTEKALYPSFLASYGIDLDEVGISIIEVGGKANLPIFMKVLEEFGIPYVVVYDEDDPKDKMNEELVACTKDPTRLCIHKPNLEASVGFSAKQRNKVEAALTFLRAGLTPDQCKVLQTPWRRLFGEVRPELVSRLT